MAMRASQPQDRPGGRVLPQHGPPPPAGEGRGVGEGGVNDGPRWLPRGKLRVHHRLAWKAFHLCCISSSSSLMNCVSWLWSLRPYHAVNPWVPAGSDLAALLLLPQDSGTCSRNNPWFFQEFLSPPASPCTRPLLHLPFSFNYTLPRFRSTDTQASCLPIHHQSSEKSAHPRGYKRITSWGQEKNPAPTHPHLPRLLWCSVALLSANQVHGHQRRHL